MDKKNLGQLIRALRRQQIDEDGNLWTRETLSKHTKLTPRLLGSIERGEQVKLDTDVLLRLADAFHLTRLERREFFFAALGIEENESTAGAMTGDDDLINLIQTIGQIRFPAFVLDNYCDVVAANAITVSFFHVPEDYLAMAQNIPAGFNMMNLIFAPTFGLQDMTTALWRDIAVDNILFFRRTTLRYRHTKYFNVLLNELRKNKLFKRYWYETHLDEVYDDTNYRAYKYTHAVHGPLHYVGTVSPVVTSSGELYLVVYIPMDLKTTEIFAEIAQHAGNTVYRFAPWPKASG